jgi:hypothetical protein
MKLYIRTMVLSGALYVVKQSCCGLQLCFTHYLGYHYLNKPLLCALLFLFLEYMDPLYLNLVFQLEVFHLFCINKICFTL